MLAPASICDAIPGAKEHGVFRDYLHTTKQKVMDNYRLNHQNQTFEWALAQRNKYSKLDSGWELSIWEAADLLNDVVDDSDPDTDKPQIVHLFQTAEALRTAYPGEEYGWLHLTGFIHDLGKLLAHPKIFNQPQWAVVGDTYPLGCDFSSEVVYSEFFLENPDKDKPNYSSRYGIYQPNCGLDNVVMSWGHDEYMYQVCVGNGCTLPEEGLYIIRFHSFYSHHQSGAYNHLLNEKDQRMLKWLKEFQRCDLYSKTEESIDVEKLRPYYQELMDKYFPPKLRW
jgi:inositol oxygenase